MPQEMFWLNSVCRAFCAEQRVQFFEFSHFTESKGKEKSQPKINIYLGTFKGSKIYQAQPIEATKMLTECLIHVR